MRERERERERFKLAETEKDKITVFTCAAIEDHFTFPTPCFITIFNTIESSSLVHVPLCNPGYLK